MTAARESQKKTLRRAFLALLFIAAVHYPRAMHAEEPVDKGWGKFISEATAYLGKQQDAVVRKFDLESWGRFFLDPRAGTLTFSTGGKPGVVAHVLIVGSISGKPGTWRWSWADSAVPESMSQPILRVRQFGERHGFDKLTEPSWPGDRTDGWKMAAAAALILSAKGAYRAPYEGGFVFLIFKELHRVQSQ